MKKILKEKYTKYSKEDLKIRKEIGEYAMKVSLPVILKGINKPK